MAFLNQKLKICNCLMGTPSMMNLMSSLLTYIPLIKPLLPQNRKTSWRCIHRNRLWNGNVNELPAVLKDAYIFWILTVVGRTITWQHTSDTNLDIRYISLKNVIYNFSNDERATYADNNRLMCYRGMLYQYQAGCRILSNHRHLFHLTIQIVLYEY